jgi:succinate dehydrogenase / fumarate reductase, flavoprotein subunit
MAGTLVTEAVRGEGGRLFNSLGERFMERYDPQRMELSTRDRVALANYTEIIEGRAGPNGGIFLDISHRDKKTIIEKLPRMYRQFMESLILDISRQPMEVAPTAHYSMGGVVVEPETHATSVVGLYAAGEVTSGVHGANRLGGNSLVETLVFGRRAGESAAEYSHGLQVQLRNRQAIDAAHDELNRITREGNELARPLQRAIRNNMWENCGVVRDEQRLRLGLQQLAEIRESTEQVDVRPSSEGYKDLALALDLRGSLVAAEATLRCALERRESRGAQQRSDYPEQDPSLLVNFTIRLNTNGEQELSRVPVPPTPEDLQAWVKISEDHSDSKRLLE